MWLLVNLADSIVFDDTIKLFSNTSNPASMMSIFFTLVAGKSRKDEKMNINENHIIVRYRILYAIKFEY